MGDAFFAPEVGDEQLAATIKQVHFENVAYRQVILLVHRLS
jgi:hypothetical protein